MLELKHLGSVPQFSTLTRNQKKKKQKHNSNLPLRHGKQLYALPTSTNDQVRDILGSTQN